ncbi:alkaline phosphatase PhoX [Flexithrix dorotheae]|uniref:alkaline phosphatase PhoX n=1 Tax=Flexithrix dorotheae TaxID=70993 RepID=UPI0003680771|nr:alkaline phosphatase PhoX [Flexithrix dorotheae]
MKEKTDTRRKFLKVSGTASLGFLGLYQFACTAKEESKSLPANSAIGYGKLKKDKEKIFNLPEGFSYKVISKRGEKMADGFLLPGEPDGMASFEGENGKVIIVRNHEISPGNTKEGSFGQNNELLSQIKPEEVYDFGKGEVPSLGGTSTFVFNEETQEIEKQYLSLAGTNRNCAGGKTPWNSWITCEEDTTLAGGESEKNHGFNFEVPATEEIAKAEPYPLKEMGRFNHEAVCVDPKTGIVYQTEDRSDGLIYRFIPNEKGNLRAGGKLQVLAIKDQKSFDTRNWKKLTTPKMEQGKEYAVEWLDIDDVESPKDDLRIRGFENGAARFARGEGAWFGDGEFYFACTNGGHKSFGQVFKYIPGKNEGAKNEGDDPGKLVLFVESDDNEILKSCDNLTIAPWGDIILCEDDPHPFLVGITPKGEFYKLGENIGFESELTGVCFSPSGKTLFVNIQHAGLTLAITGPWKNNA